MVGYRLWIEQAGEPLVLFVDRDEQERILLSTHEWPDDGVVRLRADEAIDLAIALLAQVQHTRQSAP